MSNPYYNPCPQQPIPPAPDRPIPQPAPGVGSGENIYVPPGLEKRTGGFGRFEDEAGGPCDFSQHPYGK